MTTKRAPLVNVMGVVLVACGGGGNVTAARPRDDAAPLEPRGSERRRGVECQVIVTAFDGADAGLVPRALVACTVNV